MPLHPDYQHYADWLYWFVAYYTRGEMVGNFTAFRKTAEEIMDNVLTGKPYECQYFV